MSPEARARQTIDTLLAAAGWQVCHLADVNLNAGNGPVRGVAIREFPLRPGHGFADYLLYVNGKGNSRSIQFTSHDTPKLANPGTATGRSSPNRR